MANEKVSQMVELSAGGVAANDVLLIVDTSLKETKKIQISSIVDYVAFSSSYGVSSASFADTASFVGSIDTASYSRRSGTSSFSDKTYSSDTASYINATFVGTIDNAKTASFLSHSFGSSNGTASWAMTSSFARTAMTSSFLSHSFGRSNGTASWAITSSRAISSSYALSSSHAFRSTTASYNEGLVESSSFSGKAYTSSFLDFIPINSVTASFLDYNINNGTASHATKTPQADTASYVKQNSPNIVKAWAQIIWLAGKSNPTILKSYNISEFKYLDEHDPGNTSLYFQTLWGVKFSSYLPSTDYTFVGSGKKLYGTLGTAYGALEDAPAMIFPNEQISPKYISGFTMSMAVLSQIYTAWFTAVGGANWYNQRTASVEFMIVGN